MKIYKKYNIIYADPPWNCKVWSDKGAAKSPKYDIMTIDDIKKLAIKDIADKNRILFIWVTYHLLKAGNGL